MKASEAKFIEFLRKSRQFVMPIYQRTYGWKEREPPAGTPLRDDGSSIDPTGAVAACVAAAGALYGSQ